MPINATASLAILQAIIKTVVVPANVLVNTTSAQTFQQVLQPLESNSDPNNPGLAEVFEQANLDISNQNAALLTDPVDPADVIAIGTSLLNAATSYRALQYLTRVSSEIGFPVPAQQFFAFPSIPTRTASSLAGTIPSWCLERRHLRRHRSPEVLREPRHHRRLAPWVLRRLASSVLLRRLRCLRQLPQVSGSRLCRPASLVLESRTMAQA